MTKGRRRQDPADDAAKFGDAEEDEFMAEREKIALDDQNDDGELASSSDDQDNAPVLGIKADEDSQSEANDPEEQGTDVEMESDDDFQSDSLQADDEPEFGQRKANFYGADNADYELMSSDEEEENLREEEEEVLKLQRARISGLASEDFLSAADQQRPTDDSTQFADLFMGVHNDDGGSIARLAKLSNGDQLVALKSSAPEVIKLVEELKDVQVQRRDILDLMTKVPDDKSNYDYRLLQYHYHLRTLYCTAIVFFLRLRAEGVATKAHPVVQTMVSLRAELSSQGDMASALQSLRTHGSGGFVSKIQAGPSAGAPEDHAQNDSNTDDIVPTGSGIKASHGTSAGDDSEEEEDGFCIEETLLRAPISPAVESETPHGERGRRRALTNYINQVEQETALERSRRFGAVDDEPDPLHEKPAKSQRRIITGGAEREDEDEGSDDEERARSESSGDQDDMSDGENDLEPKLNAKERRKQARSGLQKSAKEYTFRDGVADEDDRRGASKQILQNRGLTPRRNRSRKNPRVKHRNKYTKAVSRRKGAVREYRAGVDSSAYGGEATGINVRTSKSVKLSR